MVVDNGNISLTNCLINGVLQTSTAGKTITFINGNLRNLSAFANVSDTLK